MTDRVQRIQRLGEAQRRLLRLRAGRQVRMEEARLVGYIVPHAPGAVTGHDLRGFLMQRLPDYMVPGNWVFLDAFPMTSRGKIDRKALQAMGRSKPDVLPGQAAPRNERERAVAAIWEEVLGIRSVGLHDNFFDLGGHSLLLPKVLTKVRELTDRPVSMVDLFRYPTVQALTAAIAGSHEGAVEAPSGRELKQARDAGARRMKQRRAQQIVSRNT
jgi:hypothetical protein